MLNELINTPREWAKEYAHEVGRNMNGLTSFYKGILSIKNGYVGPVALGSAAIGEFPYKVSMLFSYPIGLLEPLVETPIRKSAKFRAIAKLAGVAVETLALYSIYPFIAGQSREYRKAGKIPKLYEFLNEGVMAASIVSEAAAYYLFIGDMVGFGPIKMALGTIGIRSLEYVMGRMEGSESLKRARHQKSIDDSIMGERYQEDDPIVESKGVSLDERVGQ